MRAAKVRAILRIYAVSPEPSLLAHISSESRGTFRHKARSLAPLNGWACAVKICHDGILEDSNSLDGAHLLCPATRKWRGIMLYPPKFWVSVRPSVCLSVRPSVSAHHHSCIGNSSYSFRPILLKLYRCFKDGLKICILFFQNPEIIFYHFFPIFNLDIFRALVLQICIWSMYLVSATPPTVFGESFWYFTGVLRMVWRYAYCFFRILKLFFITFFAFLT